MKISIINEEFDYNSLAKDEWHKLLKELMDIDKIIFDLENDYEVSDDRIINSDEGQARCQMFAAGGDWQEPTCYFRCQVIDGRFYCSCTDRLISPHDDGGMFCLIPPKDGGNYHLIKSDNGKFVPSDADSTKDEDERVTYDEKDCWSWLKNMLEEMHEDAVKYMREMK